MLHVAFSTVACPGWTLEEIARRAREWDFDGVELRTFGPGGTELASDPCLSDPGKVRARLEEEGVTLTGYGSGSRFDETLNPPAPLGWVLGDFERPVREFKPVLAHASRAGAGYVRVYGFELQSDEPRKRLVKRVADRLKLVCDDARHQKVTVALETGGDFSRVEDVMEVVERVGSPLLGVCLNVRASWAAGEDAADAAAALGGRLACVRLSDVRRTRGGVETPCVIGEGDVPCEAFVRALDAGDQDVPVVIEWPSLWRDDLAPGEEALPASFSAVTSWTGSAAPVGV